MNNYFEGYGKDPYSSSEKKEEQKIYKLSHQAQGALMLALQRGIMAQEDITSILEDFQLVDSDRGLIVLNPPMVRVTPENDG